MAGVVFPATQGLRWQDWQPRIGKILNFGRTRATVSLNQPRPSDDDIDAQITNACRCGMYHRIRQAIHRAAGLQA